MKKIYPTTARTETKAKYVLDCQLCKGSDTFNLSTKNIVISEMTFPNCLVEEFDFMFKIDKRRKICRNSKRNQAQKIISNEFLVDSQQRVELAAINRILLI
ncbi:hypothetical protein T07_8258 [Trichinella nelsoni]|uniref:Uncharacterized protein n=1 Tax=Trichinella nelsoni TaxID=6336 RepID=A0A0V0RZC7_9BILA|nr:hypothetical protein T07_8258 [Trichinella nelsoni]